VQRSESRTPTTADVRRAWLPIVGSLILTAYGVLRLPHGSAGLRLANTPFDHSDARDAAPRWRLLIEAGRVVPHGASVCVVSANRDGQTDTYLHRIGVALLPERRVLAAALQGVAVQPDPEPLADYVVVVGRRPVESHGSLLLEIPEGTVWRRSP
jgi:hypothetical protein